MRIRCPAPSGLKHIQTVCAYAFIVLTIALIIYGRVLTPDITRAEFYRQTCPFYLLTMGFLFATLTLKDLRKKRQ